MSLATQIKELRESADALARGLCERPPDTHAEIMRVIGEYQGLKKAEQKLIDLARSAREKGEDDDA